MADMDTVYNLTHASHAEDLTDFITGLVFNSKLSDLTIHCYNGKVKCHKVIFAMSPFLKELLSQEDDSNLFMHEIPIRDMKGLLSLLYTGSANIYEK